MSTIYFLRQFDILKPEGIYQTTNTALVNFELKRWEKNAPSEEKELLGNGSSVRAVIIAVNDRHSLEIIESVSAIEKETPPGPDYLFTIITLDGRKFKIIETIPKIYLGKGEFLDFETKEIIPTYQKALEAHNEGHRIMFFGSNGEEMIYTFHGSQRLFRTHFNVYRCED